MNVTKERLEEILFRSGDFSHIPSHERKVKKLAGILMNEYDKLNSELFFLTSPSFQSDPITPSKNDVYHEVLVVILPTIEAGKTTFSLEFNIKFRETEQTLIDVTFEKLFQQEYN